MYITASNGVKLQTPVRMERRGETTCVDCQNNNNINNNTMPIWRRGVELREPETSEFIRLNVAVFQTKYSNNFYNDVAKSGELSKLAYVENQLAGGVAVRIQPNMCELITEAVVVALGVVSDFRRQGVASALLRHVIVAAERDASINRLRLDVHKKNVAAIQLYEKMGFQSLCLNKSDEWIMVRDTEIES